VKLLGFMLALALGKELEDCGAHYQLAIANMLFVTPIFGRHMNK
jgi:hypothetical protein